VCSSDLQNRLARNVDADLRVPELDDVWTFLSTGPTLDDYATIGQGLFHRGETLPKNTWKVHDPPRPHDILGFAKVPNDLNIYGTPKLVGINLTNAAVDRIVAGAPTGEPQVLLNYAPVSRKAWKLKATFDEKGHALTNRFSAIHPKDGAPSVFYLWAVINSPIANAFAYDHLGKRDILVGTMRKMPLPSRSPSHEAAIEQAARRYREMANSLGPLFSGESISGNVNRALLEMDAAVLRAYDFPPRLERQLLDLFTGVERKGVGCDFDGYYPPGFTAYVPLHELLSEDYQRSSAGVLAKRFQPVHSKEALAALDLAEKLAEGD